MRVRQPHRLRRLLFYLLLLHVPILSARSQAAGPNRLSSIPSGHLSIQDGLSHDIAWDILQDSRGFIWIGTESGLKRSDGSSFAEIVAGTR